MGAWIEIETYIQKRNIKPVAPFMGAWIEILHRKPKPNLKRGSHPLWVRGLKCPDCVAYAAIQPVAPFMGAWIEIK